MSKPAYSISDQVNLLKQRGMIFKNEPLSLSRLKSVNYFRLKVYWQDELIDHFLHTFRPGTCFEDILERYDFDRKLRSVLFTGIEQIEIGIRARLINHMSLAYGELWYMDTALFESSLTVKDGVSKTAHLHTLDRLQREFTRSEESYIQKHRLRNPQQSAEAWIILEIASMGTISKLYKSLDINLRERGLIAKEMGVTSPKIFAIWLESISLIRNIIAHHMHLWNRTMKKWPGMQLKQPYGPWFDRPLQYKQLTKPFSTISCIVYLCNHLTGSDELKHQILSLIKSYPAVPISKYGFFNHWELEPIWRA
jgi:abortive infection bacteriophage resistance protein